MSKIYIKRFGYSINKSKRKAMFRKIRKIVKWVGGGIFIFSVVIIFSMHVQNSIQSLLENLSIEGDINATWIGSLASYWGGIIGGMVSGTLTVIGVVLTIKYYEKSDKVKSRSEHMPFLKIEFIELINSLSRDKVNPYKVISETVKGNKIDQTEVLILKLRVENIGKGFANTLVIYTGENYGGEKYHKLIQMDNKSELYIEVHVGRDIIIENIDFGIRYIDCMTNEYLQEYVLSWNSNKYDDIEIECGYPKFIQQTFDIIKL